MVWSIRNSVVGGPRELTCSRAFAQPGFGAAVFLIGALGWAFPLPAFAQSDCQMNAPCNLCRAACYSVRDIEKIERGRIVQGTFDRPYLRNRCQNGRDESGKTFTA